MTLRQSTGITYLHSDHLGSSSVTTDGNSNVVARRKYDPDGTIRPGGTGTIPTDIGFTGQRADSSTGLMDYGARYYSVVSGRFQSADTVVPEPGSPQALNRYAFVNDNPLIYTDPTGHTADCGYAAGDASCDPFMYIPDLDMVVSVLDRRPWVQQYVDYWMDPQRGMDMIVGWTAGGVAGGILGDAVGDVVGYAGERLGPLAKETLGSIGNWISEAWNGLWGGGASEVHDSRPISSASSDCSFSADTQVATADGFQAISTLVVGDQVVAYDQFTGSTRSYTVTAVLVHIDSEIEYLVVGGEQIETTPEHPFYTPEFGWIAAGKLQAGLHVYRRDGSYGVVTSTTIVDRPQAMYNLTIARAHTFFVGRGQWLVHNVCRFWTKVKEFRGKKVYQRDDLIDLKWQSTWDGRTNLDRMKAGNAPRGPDGREIELHHMLQTDESPLAEMTADFHDRYSRVMHINTNDIKSGIDRETFNAYRRAYWKNRAKDFIR